MKRWAALALAVLLPAGAEGVASNRLSQPPVEVRLGGGAASSPMFEPAGLSQRLDLLVDPAPAGSSAFSGDFSFQGDQSEVPRARAEAALNPLPVAEEEAPVSPRARPAPVGDPARAGPPGEAENRRESDPIGDVKELAARLDEGAAPADTFSRFYSLSRALRLDPAHDFSILGEPGDSIVRDLLLRAKEAISKPAPPPGPSDGGPLLVETDALKIEPARMQGWMGGIQRVRWVALPQWWSDQLEHGEKPRGWDMAVLEPAAEALNQVVWDVFRQYGTRPPLIFLDQIRVLEDAFLSEKENRGSVQEWLAEHGIPNVWNAGAFNLFREVVLSKDLLRFRDTGEADILAFILHELLAIEGLRHREIVRLVKGIGVHAKKGGVIKDPSSFKQARLVSLVRRSRLEATKLALPRPAPPMTPNSGGLDLATSDRYAVPFEPASLRLSKGIGNVEGDLPPRLPFRYAFLRFSTNYGAVAIGVYEEFDRALPGARHISFWWTNSRRKEDWQEIRLLTPGEMVDATIMAQASPLPGAPPPSIELEDFRRDLLGRFDAAVRAFLENRANPADARAYVETVYLAFRENFAREYYGEDLPDFTFARPPRG